MERRAQPQVSGKPSESRAEEAADGECRGISVRLAVPPGNRLEPMRGDRQGQHSVRINDQYRVCFAWRESNAYNVEITDYH